MSARIAALSAVVAVSLLAAARAEEPGDDRKPAISDPVVFDNQFSWSDLAYVKAGQGYKMTMSLVGWGQQASRSLRIAGDPKDFKPAEVSPEEIEKPETDKPAAPEGMQENE
jgi:hypothetical protein